MHTAWRVNSTFGYIPNNKNIPALKTWTIITAFPINSKTDLKKCGYIHRNECYTAMKINGLPLHSITCMDSIDIIWVKDTKP